MIGFYHNFWTIFCGTGNGGAYVGESAAFHIFLNMLAVEEFSPYAYALHIALCNVIVYKSSVELFVTIVCFKGQRRSYRMLAY